MQRIKQTGLPVLIVALASGLIGYIIGCSREQREQNAQATAQEAKKANEGSQPEIAANGQQAAAQPAQSSVGVTEPRGTYYPTTESLASDEMRIISLGTGMPNPRPSQKASCWLVGLG